MKETEISFIQLALRKERGSLDWCVCHLCFTCMSYLVGPDQLGCALVLSKCGECFFVGGGGSICFEGASSLSFPLEASMDPKPLDNFSLTYNFPF